MTRPPDHDIMPSIVALLLNLALLAERGASENPAMRAELFWILLPAHRAVLTLLAADSVEPEADLQASFTIDDTASESLLVVLAIRFRFIAMLIYASLNRARSSNAMALPQSLPLRHFERRHRDSAGIAADTS